LQRRSLTAFRDQYEGGWQESLPSLATPTNYKGANLGFHGEVMFLPWQYQILEDSPEKVTARFPVRLRRSPPFVTKIMTISSGASTILFEETLKNEGDETFSMMRDYHPVFGKPFLSEEFAVIVYTANGRVKGIDEQYQAVYDCDDGAASKQ